MLHMLLYNYLYNYYINFNLPSCNKSSSAINVSDLPNIIINQ